MAQWNLKSGLLLAAALLFRVTAICAETNVIAGEYIIERKPGSSRAALASSPRFSVLHSSTFIDVVRPNLGAKSAAKQLHVSIAPFDRAKSDADCAEILKDPTVAFCEPNFVRRHGASFPNDPLFYANPPQWQGQFAHYANYADGVSAFDMRSPFAWDISVGSDSVVVGIVDSGINYNHPDLAPNIWQNPNEQLNGVDDDGNGYVDDMIGVDAQNNTNDPFDCNGHGSHVAGIIGARGNNGIGVAGVAWRVKMIMARDAVDCSDAVSVAAAIRGMEYFYDLKKNRGINIVAVNASYSGDLFSQAEANAIDKLKDVNILFVAAAGNEGLNIDATPRYPAAHTNDNLISVANVNNFNAPSRIADNSNFGAQSVDFGAPGTQIHSTIEPSQFAFENYGVKSGTSMAAPAVVGALAVLSARTPAFMHYKTLMNYLYTNSRKVPFLEGKTTTGAMLHLFFLLSAAEPTDQCPNDINKIDPGFCGCGHPENYSDADNDRTPDCADQCPNNAIKTAPGICGCASADSDLNTNAVADCLDASLAGEKPNAPQLAKVKRKLVLTMDAARSGAVYVIEIQIKKPGKKKFSSKTVINADPVYQFTAPPRNSTLKIAYSFRITGPANSVTSQKSVAVIKKIR